MSRVAIVQDDNIDAAIEAALGRLDIERIVRGKTVAVKPNDTWASAKDTTAVTQGDTLRACLRYLKRFAPARLIVSGGSGAAETEDVFRLSGMMAAVEDEGAEFFDHNRPPFAAVRLGHGPQRSVKVNRHILDYETLVVLSQLKVHETATVTLALKNLAMSFPAADYYGHPRSSRLHSHSFFADIHAFIAGMTKRFPIDLAITVGHPAMVGTGPIGGTAVETGIVIASRDAVAADVVGARLLGFEVQGVRHLWEAARLRLGQAEVGKMEFPALSLDEAVTAFSERVYGERISLDRP